MLNCLNVSIIVFIKYFYLPRFFKHDEQGMTCAKLQNSIWSNIRSYTKSFYDWGRIELCLKRITISCSTSQNPSTQLVTTQLKQSFLSNNFNKLFDVVCSVGSFTSLLLIDLCDITLKFLMIRIIFISFLFYFFFLCSFLYFSFCLFVYK